MKCRPALPPKAIPKKTVASDYDSFFGDGASTAEPEVLDNEDDLWGSGDSKDDADTSSPKSSNKDVFEEDWDINASQGHSPVSGLCKRLLMGID